MPLTQSPSKKAFQHNVETEMKAHPGDRDRNLAIAYSIKRRNAKKKMAAGGEASHVTKMTAGFDESLAKQDHNPMMEDMAGRLAHGGEASQPGEQHPDTRHYDKHLSEEDHSEHMEHPEGHYNMGGSVVESGSKDMDENAAYAHGGEASRPGELHPDNTHYDEYLAESDHDEEMEHMAGRLAAGGEASNVMHSEDDYRYFDQKLAESDHAQGKVDMAGRLAEGGMAPHEAVMQRKRKQAMSEGMGEYSNLAEGGEADLRHNAQEDPNNEDQLSFDALKKENYSESEGLEHMESPEDSNEQGHDLPDEDSHDMVESVRKRMRMRNPGRSYGIR